MSNLYNLTESRNPQLNDIAPSSANNVDFISRGVVPLNEAVYLYSYYQDHINSLLWAGVLCPHSTLQSARQASTLLVAAVLTVAALHAPGRKDSLHNAYEEFVALVESSCLSRSQSLDDIRGLCIGAFYLTNLSWRLCSQAIRMATEMNLHQASLLIMRGYSDPQSHERVRLWYVLYICDHQFAIAYGRPPIMHDDAAIRNIDKFLANQNATPGDVRLPAQVKVQQILGDACFVYECDPDLELSHEDYERLRSFNIGVDQWRLKWVSKSADIPIYGSYPSKGAVLYYHFARFQLNSLSLRGISARKISGQGIPAELDWDRRESANAAIAAATNTLRLVIEEADIHKALVGVPIFTHSMIAICASFLIKMAVVFGTPASSHSPDDHRVWVPNDLSTYGLNFQTSDALKLVNDLVVVLTNILEKVSQRHLVCHIVLGLKEMLQQFALDDNGNGFVYSRYNHTHAVAVVNPGLLPSRPISRNGSVAHSDMQAPDVNFEQNVAQNDNGHFEGLGIDRDAPYMMSNFNWSSDDSFLWQTDGQDAHF